MATDLDGTIIRGDGTISDRTVAAFARVEAAGARFVLVTGRPPRWMAAIAATFGNRGTAICANGALAYDMHTGESKGSLHDKNGDPIDNEGIWGLRFGNDNATKNTLFISVGVNDEADGLLATLKITKGQ